MRAVARRGSSSNKAAPRALRITDAVTDTGPEGVEELVLLLVLPISSPIVEKCDYDGLPLLEGLLVLGKAQTSAGQAEAG